MIVTGVYNVILVLMTFTLFQGPRQGFLQLDDIGGWRDPHLRIIGGHHETLDVILFTCCKIKVKTDIVNVHAAHSQLGDRQTDRPAYPKNVF